MVGGRRRWNAAEDQHHHPKPQEPPCSGSSSAHLSSGRWRPRRQPWPSPPCPPARLRPGRWTTPRSSGRTSTSGATGAAPSAHRLAGGNLRWDTTGGTVTPTLSGRLFMNNVNGLRGRLRIDYYDAAHNRIALRHSTWRTAGAGLQRLRLRRLRALRRHQRLRRRGEDPDRGRGGGHPHRRLRRARRSSHASGGPPAEQGARCRSSALRRLTSRRWSHLRHLAGLSLRPNREDGRDPCMTPTGWRSTSRSTGPA